MRFLLRAVDLSLSDRESSSHNWGEVKVEPLVSKGANRGGAGIWSGCLGMPPLSGVPGIPVWAKALG